jgi:hypothetical protein
MFSRYVSTESTITSPSSDIGTPYIQFFQLESQISKKKLVFCIEVQKMMFSFINIIIIITFKILKWRYLGMTAGRVVTSLYGMTHVLKISNL